MYLNRSIIFLCVMMLGVSFESTAQVDFFIHGKIFNAKSREPVPYVSVYFKKSQRGTSTDEMGQFSIRLKETDFSDTLILSAIGYKTKRVASNTLRNSGKQLVLLDEDIINLSEVTIKAEAAVDIIRKAIQKRSINYGITPHKLQGVYRIADREDGAYTRLIEAAINIYDKNYLTKDSRIVDYLAIRQSKDYRTFRWKMDKLNSRNVEELLKPDLIKRPTRATHPNGFNKGFFYAFEGYSTLDGKEILIVSATKNPAYEWANYNATFYVRAEDRAIIRIDRDYSIQRPNWANADGVKTRISKDQLILQYKDINGKLFLNYLAWNLAGDIVREKNDEKVIKFERTEALSIGEVSYAHPEKIRTAWSKDIYQMVEPYNADFWTNFPIAGNQLFTEVTNELGEKENIEEQFQSGKDNEDEFNIKKKFNVKELNEDFKVLRMSLEEGHPGIYRYTSRKKMDRLFDSTRNLLSKAMTEFEFYQTIHPMIIAIRCGHTVSKLSVNHYKFAEHRNFFFPIKTAVVNDTLIATQTFDNGSVTKGDIILSINGMPMSNILDGFHFFIAADGYVKTYRTNIAGRNFADLYYLQFGKVDEFDIKVKSVNGDVSGRRVSAISFAKLNSDELRERNTNEYRHIKPGVAYLKIGTFTDSPGVQFKNWIRKSLSDISRNKINHLIIDIRNNDGGRDDFAVYLYSLLSKNPFSYHSALYAATNTYSILTHTDQDSSLNETMQKITMRDSSGRFVLNASHPTLGVHRTGELTYDGKIYVLINGGTFSTAADFAAVCKQNRRATFIGQETGGTAIGNNSNGEIMLTLPNSKIRVSMPLFMIVNAVDAVYGRGVFPDYEIRHNSKDIINERDGEIEFAIRLIDQ